MKTAASLIRLLENLRTSFVAEDVRRTKEVLLALQKVKTFPPSGLLQLHETLLFIKAFPFNSDLAVLADENLRYLEKYLVKEVRRKNVRLIKSIENSGISGSKVVATFSYELIQCLVKTYPEAVVYDSCSIDAEEFFTLMHTLLPSPLKEDFMEGGWVSVDEWLDALCGNDRQRKLQLLLTFFDEAGIPRHQRDYLFERLQLYVEADLAMMPSRTNILLPVDQPFIHADGILKKTDITQLIHEPVEENHSLTVEDRKRIVAATRWTLFALFRETDPGTYADLHDVRVFDVGRGLKIVLQGMKQERRNPIDAYIGFMAFKNGCPYAYGGAWMLGPMAKIGINVFPAFRGGESALFFAQLMRVYQQVFSPEYFVAEPYQVGRDNPEGIETGAFWFYYRLGYRPVLPALKKLAATEFQKLKTGKTKKTPASLLRKLVADELVWVEPEKEQRLKEKFDTAQLSKALFTYIRKRYHGDWITFRREALRSMVPAVFDASDHSLLSEILPVLSDYVFASGGTQGWSKQECEALHRMMLEKARGMDSAYARLLAEHSRLIKQLVRFAKDGPVKYHQVNM